MHTTIHSLIAIVTLLVPVAVAEKITLYSYEGRSHDIQWGERADEDTTTFLGFYRIGDEIDVIDDDKVPTLQSMLDVAIQHDSSMDPFFGPGISFLAKDAAGSAFIIELEYVEGDKTFNGMRCSIMRLQPIGNVPGVFINPVSVEAPSGGSSYDKRLLHHLIRIVKRQGTQDPATKPSQNTKKQNKPEIATPRKPSD